MSASRKPAASRKPRGERRSAARTLAKALKLPFPVVWARHIEALGGYQSFPHLAGPMPRPMPKHLPRLMDNGLVLHPTKGWRTPAGLPLSRYQENAA